MKRAVSVSIGSSKRNKSTELELLGEKVCIERIGTDGDMRKAAQLFRELDGQVDALGVGGTDLGLLVAGRWYPLHSVSSLVRDVHRVPVVDGNGLKITLERRVTRVLEREIGPYLDRVGRRVLLVTAVDRWGMAEAFTEAGYACTFGDLMFSLGIPVALHSLRSLKILAALLIPVVGRLPFHWVYPTGKEQEKRTPRWQASFDEAAVVAGDCHYITRYMPRHLEGKVIVTNTTTREDVDSFRQAGVKYLLTTTPVLDGRSFGTNMMEAAILAAMGRKTPVDYQNPGSYFNELDQVLDRLRFEPQLQELN
jgi:hypothetical protein